MSESIATPPTGDVPPDAAGGLQFDQAEFATPAAERPTCTVCHQPIAEEYYEVNQKVMCPRCRVGVEAAFRGGSGVARFLKATILGVLAAAAGAVLYYAFVRATNANWALIAIVVGLMVGGAVRKGNGHRGGRIYQFLAVFLTYSSIVAMNVPLLIEAVLKDRPQPPAAQVAAEKKAGGPKVAGAEARKAGAAEDPPQGQAPKDIDPARLLRILALLVGFFYAYPVLEAMEAPISGLIYLFALWEAWKINKPVQIAFNGPFRLAPADAPDVGPEEVAHES